MRGAFPARMLRRAPLCADHFEDDGRFFYIELDAKSGEKSVHVIARATGTPK